ncbi:MAG: DUF3090 domain-containing protein [Micrococcus sp.]|nr:DUF3090 domain-containing protein [Micrococcus sp.]
MTEVPDPTHEFDWPDRAVIGTLGRPGQRTFYLQARAGTRMMSVALEKLQAALLADKIDEILDELMDEDGNPHSVPVSTPVELVDNDPLDAVEESFRVGTLGLGWDPSTAQVVIDAYPIVEGDDEEDAETHVDADAEMLRIRMPVGSARAFTLRTREVVDAGRPLCTLCGHPIDPDGHTCALPES